MRDVDEARLDPNIVSRLRDLIGDERDAIANAANLAAFAFEAIPALNWLGFYFVRNDELVLGPFAGKPALTRIAHDRGVCGKAWAQARTLVVDDVAEFEDHIACDVASRAEIVVPLVRDGSVFGVLDCDSPERARFGERERDAFEALAALYVAASDPL